MTLSGRSWTRIAAGFAVALVVALAAPAFACTPSSPITVEPGSGAAGSVVDVSGRWFDADGTPVDIQLMEGQADSGPVVASVVPNEKGQFVQAVTIPADLRPGYYFFLATQRRTASSSGKSQPGRAGFEVTAPAPQKTPAQSQPAAEREPAPATAQPTAAPAQARPAAAPAPAPAATAPVATATSTPAPVAAEATPAAAPVAEAFAAPSIAAAESDLWSGFGSSAAGRAPSLVAPVSPAPQGSSGFGGLAVLVYGGAALLAGVGVAGLRRTRSRAVR